jgi:hypothetical protein
MASDYRRQSLSVIEHRETSMADHFLLISSPPHQVSDVTALAQILGITAAEARVKLNYPAASIWFADNPLATLQKTGRALQAVGARIRLIKGTTLVALQQRHRLRRFRFEDHGLTCIADQDQSLEIPYDWSVHAVVCRPMELEHIVRLSVRQAAQAANRNKSIRQEAKTKLSGIRGHVDGAFVDLYFHNLPKVHRVTLRPGDVDFTGLGRGMQPVVNQNVSHLLSRLGELFGTAEIDHTLENLPAPTTSMVGGRLLDRALEAIHPNLGKLDPYDLLSRLTFLAHVGR